MRVLLIYISAVLRPYGSSRRLRAVPQFCLCTSVCPYTVRVSSVGTVYSPLCLRVGREKHSGSVCCTELLKLLGRKGSETSAASAHRL